MQYQYPHLCAPITIAGVTFRNRMFSAPMGGTDITNDGCIGPKSTAFYELRAKGGAGAVTVSECMVHPATDGSTPTIWTRASSTLWLPPPTRQMPSAATVPCPAWNSPTPACTPVPI